MDLPAETLHYEPGLHLCVDARPLVRAKELADRLDSCGAVLIERVVYHPRMMETAEEYAREHAMPPALADLDAALAWAKKMPNVTYGSVEVRPLSVHEQD